LLEKKKFDRAVVRKFSRSQNPCVVQDNQIVRQKKFLQFDKSTVLDFLLSTTQNHHARIFPPR